MRRNDDRTPARARHPHDPALDNRHIFRCKLNPEVTPRDHDQRGSQASFACTADLGGGYPVMQALIDAGVIGDFRAPDLLRFGFTPLYLRHVDVWDAADRLRQILESRRWDDPRFHARAAVT